MGRLKDTIKRSTSETRSPEGFCHVGLQEIREKIVTVLQWEICKNDAWLQFETTDSVDLTHDTNLVHVVSDWVAVAKVCSPCIVLNS